MKKLVFVALVSMAFALIPVPDAGARPAVIVSVGCGPAYYAPCWVPFPWYWGRPYWHHHHHDYWRH
jgi:hypothetical protein